MWFNNFFPTICFDANTTRKTAKYENDLEFQNNFMNLVNLTSYAFKWDGLPETCNERFLELILILEGRACMVRDDELGYLTLKCMPEGSNLNVYGEFSNMFAYGWNGFNRKYTAYMQGSDNTTANSVICRDNDMCYPYYNYLLVGAKRLTSCMRSIDVASKKLKTPYFLVCDQSQENSVKKVIEDIEGNNDSIIVNKSTLPDMFKVLPTTIDSNILKTLWEHYNNLDAQIKTLIGIEGATNQDKKERLLVDEVNANNSVSNINVMMRLRTRKIFCENVNKMFGLNVSVSLRGEMLSNTDTNDEEMSIDDELEEV